MNAGKSTTLLQTQYNYQVFNNKVLLLTSAIDTRSQHQDQYYVESRLGIKSPAIALQEGQSILKLLEYIEYRPDCIMVDEAQFLTYQQVFELSDVVDFHNIPVICYGLRTDCFGELFEGSKALLQLADKIEEQKQLCFCKAKATHVLRYDTEFNVQTSGQQVDIGDNDKYLSVCRKHWKTLSNVKSIVS